MNPDTVTFGKWYDWEVCTEEKAAEIREYISWGKTYQIATFEATNLEGYEA